MAHCSGTPDYRSEGSARSIKFYGNAKQTVAEPTVVRNPMSIASAIAASGMGAATLRLNIAAGNIANSLSDGPLPDAANPENFPAAYTPLRVEQTDLAGGGTRATVSAVTPAAVPKFDPGAPYADGSGLVAAPNVDLANEIVQTMIARYTFAANAQVIRADAQMSAALLDIKA
jgi:flagellar basal-body rod protein FlgC